MKKCPYCAEEIQDEAVICRFCNRDLPKPNWYYAEGGDTNPELLEQLPKKEEVTAAAKTPTPVTPWRKPVVFVGLVGLAVAALALFIPRVSFQVDGERTPEAAEAEKVGRTEVLTQQLLGKVAKQEWEEAGDLYQQQTSANLVNSGAKDLAAVWMIIKPRWEGAKAKRAEEERVQKQTKENQRTPAASKALAYLNTEVPEVAWVEVEGNEAFIGFKERPSDLRVVVNMAAFNGNRAIGFGFHVWAVDATVAQKGWQPGDPGLICEATARKGKVTDSSCPNR